MSEKHVEKYKHVQAIFEEIVGKTYLTELSGANCLSNENLPNELKWVEISKIVYEQGVFLPDKLTLFYSAMHSIASRIVFSIQKRDSVVHLYLGVADDKNVAKDNESLRTMQSALHGYLPGILCQPGYITPVNNLNIKKMEAKNDTEVNHNTVTCVSAVGSLVDDQKDSFIQGIEKLIDSSSQVNEYSVYLVAQKVSSIDGEIHRLKLERLYSDLMPLAQGQLSFSQNQSESVSLSLSKSFSNSIGSSFSENHSQSSNKSRFSSTANTLGVSASGGGFGVHGSRSWINGESEGTQTTLGYQTGINKMLSEIVTSQKNVGQELSKGISQTISLEDRTAKQYLSILDQQIRRIQLSRAYGLWSFAAYFVTPSKANGIMLANVYKGAIIGDESSLQTVAINSWEDNNHLISRIIQSGGHPCFEITQGANMTLRVDPSSLVNSKELGVMMSLPEKSIPGIIVRAQARFGQNPAYVDNGKLKLGEILCLGAKTHDLHLNLASLSSHAFITGTTGSGKSNAMYVLIDALCQENKKVLIIEPTKGEYKKVFGGRADFSVYGSNPARTRVLRINPFEFPESVHIYEHIDRVVDIFNACWPMYAAMPVVLKKAIVNAYKKCGWNLEKNRFIKGEVFGNKLFPTVQDVVIALKEFIDSSDYSADTKSDYKGALETRLISLTEGLTGEMLNENNTSCILSDENLFNENVIIDLSGVGNSETRSLIMGLIIMKLNEYRLSEGKEMNNEICHVTVLEEAHNILKRTSKDYSQESSNLEGKSVEMICNGIAEMRTYGEGFIIVDQSPSQVDLAAIRNTNTKIILSLPDADDRYVAGKSAGLSDSQIEEIGKLHVGEAVVYQNNWEEAVQCKISLFEKNKYSPYNPAKDEKRIVLYPESNTILPGVIDWFMRACNGKEDSFKEDADRIRNQIRLLNLPSSNKLLMLNLIEKIVDPLWTLNENEHGRIMDVIAMCIGNEKRVEDCVRLNRDLRRLDSALSDLMSELLFIRKEDELMKFCVRSVLRHYVSRQSADIKVYNSWLRDICKMNV